MAILQFQRPEKVIVNATTDTHGQFEFRPLEPGYGLTVGNALRRVLLNSLEGFAFTSVRIYGVEHEFSTIKGVVEDVTEIVLNLKQVRLKRQIDSADAEVVKVSLTGKDQLTAGDLGSFMTNYQVLNPDMVICNMDASVKIEMELTIEKGRGYIPAEENKKVDAALGTIALDAIYTPIKNVNYSIENFRVEQKTDFEKLILDIHTDGSIAPQDALTDAAQILIQHFLLFTDERMIPDSEPIQEVESYDEEVMEMRKLLLKALTELELSVRALNCLKAAEVETVADLVSYTKADLMKFRNFGKKSLTELEELVAHLGLSFGMDTTKYKLDKE
ncbi:MAG TPA: DNA-directed RNA polymerase subunit alpha [Cryomorphaceae bacterium]|jgi:DNA-directed RNA polymerase subunit alpha|nr:MAG: DNA-directed RNA polymerase subunit alpha [Cryomorphaceae bacterium BACL7 MAG-120910-bin2]KRO69462.1 MAG: DNA-directed RNA polymerase subunit alpha [Cryomorphaceae bacterium BACL7 MAG-120322-bin74]KRO82720.1 MAG: DNA-directed RNA polymerase subunit alpha [Cryomorphaceae bacterium BACL7 MAG-121220-bin83]NQW25114.1 DNA-directed RNA polymerase subunit alpha [Cryomorphaceae bacterium]HAB31903.1 DNA-directed RNA polymerase subunit alpha [Cryomorphaceae bacterium]